MTDDPARVAGNRNLDELRNGREFFHARRAEVHDLVMPNVFLTTTPEMLKNLEYEIPDLASELKNAFTADLGPMDLVVPAQMSQALRQLRPPAPEEVEEKKKSTASSKVKELLSNIRSSAGAILQSRAPNQSFAPAFRMNADGVSKEDEEILNAEQADLDAQERNDER